MTTTEQPPAQPLDDRAQRLRERVEADYPASWEFELEPLLVGTVESFHVVTGSYGDTVVCQLREAGTDRPLAVWLSQTALLAKFRDIRPNVGELVAIRYLGEKGGEGPKRAYHAFRVEVDRPGQTFDWDTLDRPPVVPAEPARPAADEYGDDVPF